MNSENTGSPEYNRQNQLIDVLLTENLYLKQIIRAHLLEGKGISADEIARLQLIAGNNEGNISTDQLVPGNLQSGISTGELPSGNSQMRISTHQLVPGNFEMDISRGQLPPGNNEMKVSSVQVEPGVFEHQYNIVLQNLAPIMLTAGKRAVRNTATMIVQLLHNAATPLHEMRKMTGMSNDGMSNRIMAMKKAGLITRISAPKRYLLSNKATDLFIEKGK